MFAELRKKRSDAVAILTIILLCAIFLSPYLLAHPIPLIYPQSDLGTDLELEVIPNIEYIVQSFNRTGHIPLWRNFLFSGAPLIGHPSIPIYYPPYSLFLVLPLALGLNLIVLIHFIWMGIGIFSFIRITLRTEILPAFLGTVAFIFAPYLISHLGSGHLTMLSAFAWLPWSLLAFDRFWKTRRLLWFILFCISLTCIGMNHVPVFFITCISLAVVSIGHLFSGPRRENLKSLFFVWGKTIPTVGCLLCAQFLPYLELAPDLIHTVNKATFASLHPLGLTILLFPPTLNLAVWFLFPGLTVLAFALLGWTYGWSKIDRIWGAIGLAGILLSFGDYTPIYRLFFGWNFLISVLRSPTIWWTITVIALAILASSGMRGWLKNRQELNRKGKIVVVVLLAFEIAAGIVKLRLGNAFPFDMNTTIVMSCALSVILLLGSYRKGRHFPFLVLALMVVELFMIDHSLIKPTPVEIDNRSEEKIQPVASRLLPGDRLYSPDSAIPARLLVQSGLQSIGGYDALPSASYMRFIRLATGCPLLQEMTFSKEEKEICKSLRYLRADWLKLLNVKLLITQNEDQLKITTVDETLGRAFSVETASTTTAGSCLADLQKVEPLSVVLVEGDMIARDQGIIQVIDRQTALDRETFTLNVSGGPALLIRSENWMAGWKVKVNGSSTKVIRVDCVLQGVWLEPGQHTLEFYYQPFSYPLCIWISGVTFFILMIAAGINIFLRNKRPTDVEAREK